VVKLARDAVPSLADAHDVVALTGMSVAVLREIDSWLQPESLRACRQPVGSTAPPLCAAAIPRSHDTRSPERFLFLSRSHPQTRSIDVPRPYLSTYEIPLLIGTGEERDLTVTDQSANECAWRITRAEGVQVAGNLPARQVRLRSRNGSPGLLVVEKPFGTPACARERDSIYPPCVFEARPGDPLRALVDAG
jgi:hypothetical protein